MGTITNPQSNVSPERHKSKKNDIPMSSIASNSTERTYGL